MNEHKPLSVLHLARLVLESRTPLSIGTGQADGVFDTALVRDANGLPAIPGSSLAGVLRHLWRETEGEGEDRLFGYQRKEEGQASRLVVSWGCLLDSRGLPAEGLLLDKSSRQRLKDDPLYSAVLDQADAPVLRDRVCLTHRGAAKDEAKFDRSVLPAGHRFAVELRYWSDEPKDKDWEHLLSLFCHPLFRLGAATRAGLGAMMLRSCHAGVFDLRDPEAARSFRALGRGIADTSGLAPVDPAPPESVVLEGELWLTARGLWRIGQGNEPLSLGDEPLSRDKKVADLLPRLEEQILWPDEGVARRALKFALLPASSLKGALAHRLAFHLRCLEEQWTDKADEAAREQRPAGVDALLGSVKRNAKKGEEAGRAGTLYLDDAWIPTSAVQVQRLMHNAIDRFTGGVRDRMLYEEESLYKGTLTVRVVLDVERLQQRLDGASLQTLRRALRRTFDDLCAGRLALGSRTTTGNGFFEGELHGAFADWLATGEETKEAVA